MKHMLLSIAVVMLLSPVVCADPFVNRPEEHWPFDGPPLYNPWVTPFPYQRNIRYDFATDVNTWPQDPAVPRAYDSLPGVNVTLQGTDDQILHPSDYIEWEGLTWFPIDPVGGSKTGVIGIDNRQGVGPATGQIIFHLDNWDQRREFKHIWKEIIYDLCAEVGIEAKMEEILVLPEGFEVVAKEIVLDNPIGDGYRMENMAWKVWENPPWEEIIITLNVPVGSYAFIDDVHFATECVPEPASMTLAILGGGALLALRRRRRC